MWNTENVVVLLLIAAVYSIVAFAAPEYITLLAGV
jgi:hypothetical protein